MREYTVGVKKLKDAFIVKNMGNVTELLRELRDAEVEVPTVLHMMPDHSVREVETCAVGSMMSVSVEARTIFAHALGKDDDRSLILVHNHAFQRRADPSWGDREFANGIKMAASLLGVHVLDSVIIGTKEDYSFMESGNVFEKSNSYKPTVRDGKKWPPATFVKASSDSKVSSSKKAVELVAGMTKATSEPTLAVIHLTPDMEPSTIAYYPLITKGVSAKDEARRILRDSILCPSTKYMILVSNEWMFHGKHYEQVSERLRYMRLGATVLCLPIVDMIMIGDHEEYSFAEHGKEFPKSKVYVMVDDEGMKLKGPPKTRRSDLPPYSWTFK